MEYYAGIDLGGTNIKCGIVDETGTVIKYESIPTNREKGFSNVVSTITCEKSFKSRECLC